MVWVADVAWIPHYCGSGIGRVATAPIQPLAWEPPYAEAEAQEIAKKTKQKQKQKETNKQTKKPTEARKKR